MQQLAALGSNLSKMDYFENDALTWASRGGHLHVVKELLKLGDGINNNQKRTPIMWAAKCAHLDIVRYFAERGEDLDQGDEICWTALHWAARYNRVSAVLELVDSAASVDVQDESGCTPLMLAAAEGHLQVLCTD